MKRILYFLSMLGILALNACEPEPKQPNLSVSPESVSFSPEGSSQTISISANGAWKVSASDSWLSVTPSSGAASDNPVTVTVNCSANTTYEDRSATLTIKMEDLTRTVTVQQSANLGLILATKAYDLTSDAQSFDVEVQANVEYTVSVSDKWVKQTGTKALISKTLTFSIEENTSYDGRNATITLKPQDSSAAEQVVTVRQGQKDALIVKDTSFDLPYGGGGVEIKVETNVDFDVKPGVDWIHYSETKALSSPTVYLTVDANETSSAREGNVVIKQKNGSLQHTVTIRQDGKIAVSSIVLNCQDLTLREGQSETLIATISPEDASNKTVTWISGNEEVATVDENGCVTGVKAGTALITAKAEDQEACCLVTVTGKEEESIKASLMKFYDAMDGPNWKITKKWDLSKPLNDWEGVKWYRETGELELYFNGEFGLKGELPNCFDELTALTTFLIQHEPGVSGTLPSSFSKLKNMRVLTLGFTSMTSLPDIFEGLPLQYVLISTNESMTGTLPESLGSSPDLSLLGIGGNAFTGTVPDSWARLGTALDLGEASLDERVPDSFVNSEYADYLVNMYLTAAYWRTSPLVVGDYDISAYWPDREILDLVTGEAIPYKEIVSRNKVTVLLNWATWCPFSKTLMPILVKMYDKYHDSGLEIIAAYNADTPEEDMGRPLKDILLERHYDKWYNFNIWNFSGTEWNMWCAGTPSAILVDNKGVVLATSRTGVSDPSRNRFGYPASTNLIPILEEFFGPLEEGEDDYESTDYSRDGEVMTIQKATVGKGINIVFMGDAYTDRDMDDGGLYEQMMDACAEELFAIEPYKTFRNRFNVYAVKVVSKNGKTGVGYTTTLGTVATYNSISNGNDEKCYEYALKVPEIKSDKNLLVGVLVNSVSERGITSMSESRQSGVAVYGSRNNIPEAFGGTLRHEAGGHGFAFLDDEYVMYQTEATQEHINFRNAMYQQYGWYSNVDFTDDPAKIKWSVFLSDERYKDEVGIFEGGSLYMKGAYRPSENSMMRANEEYYNAPSRWAIYKRIMELSGEEASFDKFLEYDAVNRGKAHNAPVRPPLKAAESHPAGYLAPPVVVP